MANSGGLAGRKVRHKREETERGGESKPKCIPLKWFRQSDCCFGQVSAKFDPPYILLTGTLFRAVCVLAFGLHCVTGISGLIFTEILCVKATKTIRRIIRSALYCYCATPHLALALHAANHQWYVSRSHLTVAFSPPGSVSVCSSPRTMTWWQVTTTLSRSLP